MSPLRLIGRPASPIGFSSSASEAGRLWVLREPDQGHAGHGGVLSLPVLPVLEKGSQAIGDLHGALMVLILQGFFAPAPRFDTDLSAERYCTETMDTRLLDLLIGVVALLVMILLIVGLPLVLPSGLAYLLALAIFIVLMSVAGYVINEKIR